MLYCCFLVLVISFMINRVIRMSGSLQEYCVQNNRYELLEQWNYARNVGLTPADVTYGSKKKVWWRCGKGHEWQTAVYVRTGSNSGCPYCTGKQTASGESDLLSQRPDLAAQWHPTKNGAVTPDCVSLGSHKTVWWICEKGHEWRAMVKTRVRGYGCPVCTNRVVLSGVNDLASTHPDIAQQWHHEKNGSFTPRDVLAGSLRKVWWRCEKGHEWQAFIGSRTNGNGCPVCAGKYVISGENDLASLFPVVAAQ